MLTLFVLAVILICLVDGVPLVKKRLWRELGAFGVLLGIAIFLFIANKLEMPTPVDWLQQMLAPVGEAILK